MALCLVCATQQLVEKHNADRLRSHIEEHGALGNKFNDFLLLAQAALHSFRDFTSVVSNCIPIKHVVAYNAVEHMCELRA
jgi:hypothetical protein